MAQSMDEYGDMFTIPAGLFPTEIKAISLESVGVRVYLAHITADIAEVLLKHKNKNRTVHLSQLNKLKRTLELDRWEINGETIIFDHHGHLIEGQHRLRAVVETKKSIWTLIVHGINFERFKTMGQASKRTAGDILGINGEKDGRLLAAALRWVYRYKNSMMMNPHPVINDDELADTLPFNVPDNPKDGPSILDSIPFGRRCAGVAAPGMCTALHYLCKCKSIALANDFFWRFGTGENLERGDPILILRNRMQQGLGKKLTRFVLRDEQKAPVIVNTWNLLREDPKIKIFDARKIAWHGKVGQKFPEIL